MTAPREPVELIRAFLDEGQNELPERAMHAVRRDIHRTRQRVVIGPWRESQMSKLARMAIGVAAVVAVAVVSFNVVSSRNGTGVGSQPGPSPSPTATPPLVAPDARIEAGRYLMQDVTSVGSGPFQIAITVPAGYSSLGFANVVKPSDPADASGGTGFGMWEITNRYVHPCTNHTLMSPVPDSSVDALVATLASQPGITAGPAMPVTIDGYRGKSVELTVATNIDTCGRDGFWLWGDAVDHRYVQSTGETDRIYVLDVDGVRRTFFLRIPANTTAADRAELEAIVAIRRHPALIGWIAQHALRAIEARSASAHPRAANRSTNGRPTSRGIRLPTCRNRLPVQRRFLSDECSTSQRHHGCPAGHRHGPGGAARRSGGQRRGVASTPRARVPDDIRRGRCRRSGGRDRGPEGTRRRRRGGRSLRRAPRRHDLRPSGRRRPSSPRNQPARPRHGPRAPVRVRIDRGSAGPAAHPLPRRECRGEAGDVGSRVGRTDTTWRAAGAARGTRSVAAALERDVHAGDQRGLSNDRARAAGARCRRPPSGAR